MAKIEIAQNEQFLLLQNCLQLFSVIILIFIDLLCVFVKMFSKSFAAVLLCVETFKMNVYLLKSVENIVAKGYIAHYGNFSFCQNDFISRLLYMRQISYFLDVFKVVESMAYFVILFV